MQLSVKKLKRWLINKHVEVLAGKLNFLSSAALMKNAVMNYTNDSAPLHFASAMDAPVTAIFCSTVPSFGFYPLSAKSFIVETKEELACKPCSLHGLKPARSGISNVQGLLKLINYCRHFLYNSYLQFYFTPYHIVS